MATKVIGCKLPNGLVIDFKGKSVDLKGANSSLIIGAEYGMTEVDAEFWESWSKEHKDFAPLVNNVIFEAKSESESKVKAKELSKEKTGFEGASQTAHNISPATRS